MGLTNGILKSYTRQRTILRAFVDVSWYVTNVMIHNVINIPTVKDVIHERIVHYREKLEIHTNRLPRPLLQDDVTRRLKIQ